jgi:hypothetical protein
VAVNTKPSSSSSVGVGALGIDGARGMDDGGLEASRLMLRDLCEYTEPCRRGADEKAFKDGPNDEAGLKLPVVDGGRELNEDPNGVNASKLDNVVVGEGTSSSSPAIFVGSSMSTTLSGFVFLHFVKGLKRRVHCLGEGSDSQRETDERKDPNEWRSFISTVAGNDENSKRKTKTI